MFGRPGALQLKNKKPNIVSQQPKLYRPFHMWAKLFQGPIVLINQKLEIKLTLTHSRPTTNVLKLIDDGNKILVLYNNGFVDTYFVKFPNGKPLTVNTNLTDDEIRNIHHAFQKLPLLHQFCLGRSNGTIELYSSSEWLMKFPVYTNAVPCILVLRDGNLITWQLYDFYQITCEMKHIDLFTKKITNYTTQRKWITSIIELPTGLLLMTYGYTISTFDRWNDAIVSTIDCMNSPQLLHYFDTRLVYWDSEKFHVMKYDLSSNKRSHWIPKQNWIPQPSFYHFGEQRRRNIMMYVVDDDCLLSVSDDGIVCATDIVTTRCYFKHQFEQSEMERQDFGPETPMVDNPDDPRPHILLPRPSGRQIQTHIDRGPLMVVHGVHTTKEDKLWIVQNRLACLHEFLITDLLLMVVDYWM